MESHANDWTVLLRCQANSPSVGITRVALSVHTDLTGQQFTMHSSGNARKPGASGGDSSVRESHGEILKPSLEAPRRSGDALAVPTPSDGRMPRAL